LQSVRTGLNGSFAKWNGSQKFNRVTGVAEMNHSLRRIFFVCAALMVCVVVTGTSKAQDPQTPLAANLFYNHYTQGANQVNSQLYLAPRPVPAYVGHSYYTYQPLQPHEHMYEHARNYYNWYAGPEATYANPCRGGNCGQMGGGSLNKTTVKWYSGYNYQGPLLSGVAPFQRLNYRLANYWYCPETAKKALQPRFGNLPSLRGIGGVGAGCSSGNCGGTVGGGGCASGNCAALPTTARK